MQKWFTFTFILLFGLAVRAAPVTGVDCHMHVNPEAEEVPLDGKRVLLALDSAGLSHACILSQGYQKPWQEGVDQYSYTKSRNDWTLAEAKKSDRLIGFCGVPIPKDWAAEEVRRCIISGARGLKLHQTNDGISLLEEANQLALKKILRAVDDKLVVLIHIKFADKAEIREFFKITQQFPNTKFIAAHTLGQNVAMVAEAPKNVFIEISGLVQAPLDAGIFFIEKWRGMGMDRVLLGSDWPIFHPAEHVYYLNHFPLLENERRAIIRDNAVRLFNLN